jgi:hypothetical protein
MFYVGEWSMSFTESFAATAAAIVDLGFDDLSLASLPDESLLAAHNLLTDHRRHAELYAALLAGEIARRSSRETGYAGLAQRKGFPSAHVFLQSLAPITRAEAIQLVEAGTLMAASADSAESTSLWETALASALLDGTLSVAAADAIRRGLELVADTSPAAELLRECERLLARVALVSLDELRREARSARDRLDDAGIARREKERRDNRYLKRWIRDDGMYAGSFLLDPEGGQRLFSALDSFVAPRRGVRFVDAAAQADAAAILADPRTNDQLLADALVDMVQLAVDADPSTLFGAHRPAVRVVVTEQTLAGIGAEAGGHGFLEGDLQPVSRETIDRFICDTGHVKITFDRNHQIIDLGRTQRLFSSAQRLAISVRDGGCLMPGCTRPPSGCEAHHIIEWKHGGRTDARDGVLLCRHHHMLLHTNHWKIVRKDSDYWFRPPASEDPAHSLQALHTKSPLMRELAACGAR